MCQQNSIHRNGAEVARELNISRAAVSQSLKKSLLKSYKWFRKENSPYESFQLISLMCNCIHEDDMKELFKFFPIKIKKDIRNDAIN